MVYISRDEFWVRAVYFYGSIRCLLLLREESHDELEALVGVAEVERRRMVSLRAGTPGPVYYHFGCTKRSGVSKE